MMYTDVNVEVFSKSKLFVPFREENPPKAA